MLSMILKHDVAKELILLSMSLDITHDSQPYSSTVTHVVLKSLTLILTGMIWLFQMRSNFQNADHARAFRLIRSFLLEAIMHPRYLKSGTCLIGSPYTSRGGCGLQMIVIYSVLGTLMIRPRLFAADAVLTVPVPLQWMILAELYRRQNLSHLRLLQDISSTDVDG